MSVPIERPCPRGLVRHVRYTCVSATESSVKRNPLKEVIMNATPAVSWTVVSVRFNSLAPAPKFYDYRTDLSFQPGDTAVVEVSGALKCVDIMDVRPSGSTATRLDERDLKWIVAKVDTDRYLARMKEVEAVQREMSEVMAEAERRRVVQEVKQALSDPDLVARYDSLLARQAQL